MTTPSVSTLCEDLYTTKRDLDDAREELAKLKRFIVNHCDRFNLSEEERELFTRLLKERYVEEE